tara:strand:+ start:29 stop:253 length:225 start_codon:yes stop_codon:yes gene_type:complete
MDIDIYISLLEYEKAQLYRRNYYLQNKDKIQKYQKNYYRKYIKKNKKKKGRPTWKGEKIKTMKIERKLFIITFD